MLHKQKGCASPMLHIFTLLNLINGKYFHIFLTISQNKSTSIVLLLRVLADLTILLK